MHLVTTDSHAPPWYDGDHHPPELLTVVLIFNDRECSGSRSSNSATRAVGACMCPPLLSISPPLFATEKPSIYRV